MSHSTAAIAPNAPQRTSKFLSATSFLRRCRHVRIESKRTAMVVSNTSYPKAQTSRLIQSVDLVLANNSACSYFSLKVRRGRTRLTHRSTCRAFQLEVGTWWPGPTCTVDPNHHASNSMTLARTPGGILDGLGLVVSIDTSRASCRFCQVRTAADFEVASQLFHHTSSTTSFVSLPNP